LEQNWNKKRPKREEILIKKGEALKNKISEITKVFVVLIRHLADWKKVTNFVACFSKQQAPIIVRPM
jgi:hypothetical protein